MRQLLFNAKLIREDEVWERGYAAFEDGVIIRTGRGEIPQELKDWPCTDLEGSYLSPGFIDNHVHGGGNYDFMDGSVEAILGAARAHMQHGTTSIVPTALSSSEEELFSFFDNFELACRVKENMPNLLGVHLEGPFFSKAQAGAQPERYLRNPSVEYAEKVYRRAGSFLMRWSMAPELPGAMETARWLSERGVLVSAAHTDCEYGDIEKAVRNGFTHMTHFYSGMSMLKRKNAFRVLGAVECGYLFDELRIEIIADGMHLPPELLRLILKCKDHSSITLITDSMRGAGMPDGPSVLGSLKDGVPVILEDGIAKLPDRSAFAGSVATSERLVATMVRKAGLSIPEAVSMISSNVAKLYNIYDKLGSIEEGKQADLVVFNEDIQVSAVYVRGCRVR